MGSRPILCDRAAECNYQQYGEVRVMDQGNVAVVLDFEKAKRRREQSSEPWVKKDTVAAHFDVSTRTVYRWVQQGCPIKRLPGGSLRFQLGPMKEWLEAHKRT